MKFKLSFFAFWICLGVMGAGIYLADQCLTVFGMIAMTLNAALHSVCMAMITPVPTVHRNITEHYYDNPEKEVEHDSSGDSSELGDPDSQ